MFLEIQKSWQHQAMLHAWLHLVLGAGVLREVVWVFHFALCSTTPKFFHENESRLLKVLHYRYLNWVSI